MASDGRMVTDLPGAAIVDLVTRRERLRAAVEFVKGLDNPILRLVRRQLGWGMGVGELLFWGLAYTLALEWVFGQIRYHW